MPTRTNPQIVADRKGHKLLASGKFPVAVNDGFNTDVCIAVTDGLDERRHRVNRKLRFEKSADACSAERLGEWLPFGG